MKRYLVLPLVLLAASLGAVVLAGRTTSDDWPSEGIPETRAVRGDVEVTVRAVGELKAEQSTTISSSVRGDRGKIVYLVNDGAKVSEGDVLVRLDPTPFEEETHKLRAKVQELLSLVEVREQSVEWEKVQAEKEIELAAFEHRLASMELEKLVNGDGPLELGRLEAEFGLAKREFEEASEYLGDLDELKARGYINETEITLAGQRREEKERRYGALNRQLESFRDYVLPGKTKQAEAAVEKALFEQGQMEKAAVLQVAKAMADLKEARMRLEHSQVLLDAARRELEATVITAPIPGMAVLHEEFRGGEKRKPRVGDTVWPNQALIRLPDLSSMLVSVRIREIDLHRVSKGMGATVIVEAYPDLRLPGEVRGIGVLAQRDEGEPGGEKYFQVLLSILQDDERLRPGMTATVTIHSRAVKDALTLPLPALFEREGRFTCYVRGPEGYSRREVSVGIVSDNTAEITGGLDPGEVVSLVRPPEALLAGRSPGEGR